MVSVLLQVAVGSMAMATQSHAIHDSMMTITALQWNPHWQCFEKSDDCKSHALKALSARLENGTDFANIVELEAENISLPTGWANISSACGRDLTTLFFDSTRWKVADGPKSGEKGCMVDNDRSYVVQMFEHRVENLKVVVIGAHFPHQKIGTTLPESIQTVVKATGVDSTLLIADTNINQPGRWPHCPSKLCKSNAEVLKAIGVTNADVPVATELKNTCCLNPPYGFSFAFDRIIANFGVNMTTLLHDDPTPTWAVGAFHKGITGRLMVRGSKTEMPSQGVMEQFV
eukprot:gnl/MRDRNA2_/MRDRNA2_27847_c0_seq1.p1 gnl/MRDRNA2_/MRDRNA2_27847_c0~~gnl/MRDRNA2_/MRDRNA2_27847_c0_seq1.p1  ORF type:complete len:287 (-),score=37.00 gnl/MRDRNA2_/MRDRNA2_27847_c0_seq1:100-960(-)